MYTNNCSTRDRHSKPKYYPCFQEAGVALADKFGNQDGEEKWAGRLSEKRVAMGSSLMCAPMKSEEVGILRKQMQ